MPIIPEEFDDGSDWARYLYGIVLEEKDFLDFLFEHDIHKEIQTKCAITGNTRFCHRCCRKTHEKVKIKKLKTDLKTLSRLKPLIKFLEKHGLDLVRFLENTGGYDSYKPMFILGIDLTDEENVPFSISRNTPGRYLKRLYKSDFNDGHDKFQNALEKNRARAPKAIRTLKKLGFNGKNIHKYFLA